MDKQELKRWRDELAALDYDGLRDVETLMVERAEVVLGEKADALREELAEIERRRDAFTSVRERQEREEPDSTSDPKPQRAKKSSRNASNASPKGATPGSGGIQGPILAVLEDEGGPLSKTEIAERVGKFGYDAKGADMNTIKARVNAALTALQGKSLIDYLGRDVGYALTK